MAVDFRKMCDKCYRQLGDNEQMYGFKLIDDFDNIRMFKGHKGCVDVMMQELQQLYGGMSEKNEKDSSN